MIEIIRSSTAQRDTARILEYLLEEDAVDAAIRFSNALEATYEKIAQSPDSGIPWESDEKGPTRLHYWHVLGFRNFLIFGRPTLHGLLIVRLFHGHQDIESELRKAN